jgi:hypothetical protein
MMPKYYIDRVLLWQYNIIIKKIKEKKRMEGAEQNEQEIYDQSFIE